MTKPAKLPVTGQVTGKAVVDKINEVMGQVSDELGDVRIRVQKVEGELAGSVTTDLFGLV